MALTKEQQTIVDVAADPSTTLLKVSAVAGSGKSHTLQSLAEKIKPKSGLYVAFNKSVAEEAKLSFPYYIECRTIHSLAYKYVMHNNKQELKELSIDDITTRHKPEKKRAIINAMNKFFISSSLSLSYLDEIAEPDVAKYAKDYISKMVDRKVPATFNFLVKYFYLQLHSGAIKVNYDLIMLDEAGDLSEVTLEIFKLLNAPKKVMVGDKHQNIYQFINTVNGFEKLKDEGIELTLSQSFRVREDIAKPIEAFCKNYIDASMEFKGTHFTKPEDNVIRTQIYLSRTNSRLIARMMELHDSGIQYTLLRDPKEIFALPLALISASTGKPVYRMEYKYLEREYNSYISSPQAKTAYKNFHRYLREIHGDDENIMSALKLLETHTYAQIFDTYKRAQAQPKRRQPITLGTAHTAKGGTYDSVYIEDDLNRTTAEAILQGPETSEYLQALNLYYVAVTRCRLELVNATVLNCNNEQDLITLLTK